MDNYTKFILTVIAVSMFKIAFFEIKPIENAYAETQVERAVCFVGKDCNANYGPALRIHIVNK